MPGGRLRGHARTSGAVRRVRRSRRSGRCRRAPRRDYRACAGGCAACRRPSCSRMPALTSLLLTAGCRARSDQDADRAAGHVGVAFGDVARPVCLRVQPARVVRSQCRARGRPGPRTRGRAGPGRGPAGAPGLITARDSDGGGQPASGPGDRSVAAQRSRQPQRAWFGPGWPGRVGAARAAARRCAVRAAAVYWPGRGRRSCPAAGRPETGPPGVPGHRAPGCFPAGGVVPGEPGVDDVAEQRLRRVLCGPGVRLGPGHAVSRQEGGDGGARCRGLRRG